MAQDIKKTHYVFNRYIKTPQPQGLEISKTNGVNEGQRVNPNLLAPGAELRGETPSFQSEEVHQEQDSIFQQSKSISILNEEQNVSKTDIPGQSRAQSRAQSSKVSVRGPSSRAKTAKERTTGSRLSSSKSAKPSRPVTGSRAQSSAASGQRKKGLKERILQYSEGEDDESGASSEEFASE